MFKPCVVFPVFNHRLAISSLVEELYQKNIPCIIVNDGSDDKQCKEELNRVSGLYQNASLITLETNQGKGQAVMTGMRVAQDMGYTHVVQIDSDGQYSLDSLDRFLHLTSQKLNSVISGFRPPSQMPKYRRYGRSFTDFWVNLYTFSKDIKDSMCGYRVYPLRQTLDLINKNKIRKRMDFDTDIIVRLYWHGISIDHVTVEVKYDENIISHFHYFLDNVRITTMHIRLFITMIGRVVLCRK